MPDKHNENHGWYTLETWNYFHHYSNLPTNFSLDPQNDLRNESGMPPLSAQWSIKDITKLQNIMI